MTIKAAMELYMRNTNFIKQSETLLKRLENHARDTNRGDPLYQSCMGPGHYDLVLSNDEMKIVIYSIAAWNDKLKKELQEELQITPEEALNG